MSKNDSINSLGIITYNPSTPAGSQVFNASGSINFANQPSFLAHVTATSAAVTGDNTIYTVAAFTTDYDVGSNFNAATGTFTAPVAGKYMFWASLTLGSLVVGNSNGFFFSTNNFFNTFNWGAIKNTGGQVTVSACWTANLAASNTMNIKIQEQNNGAKNVTVVGGAGNSVFGGFLIG